MIEYKVFHNSSGHGVHTYWLLQGCNMYVCMYVLALITRQIMSQKWDSHLRHHLSES